MINLVYRSNQKELLDGSAFVLADIEQMLKELDIINRWLGGHRVTIEGLKKLLTTNGSVVICEIGCGSGSNLYAINKYCKKKGIEARFIGIDMNPDCIAFAQKEYAALNCRWICSDYKLVDLSLNKPDIIFSSLFCHHLDDQQLDEMLYWLQRNSTRGFFINDLHRHWLAYYLIKYITRYFSRSYLIKNDACISVAKGFKRNEWQYMLSKQGIVNYRISWKWAFRHLITCKINSYETTSII